MRLEYRYPLQSKCPNCRNTNESKVPIIAWVMRMGTGIWFLFTLLMTGGRSPFLAMLKSPVLGPTIHVLIIASVPIATKPPIGLIAHSILKTPRKCSSACISPATKLIFSAYYDYYHSCFPPLLLWVGADLLRPQAFNTF